MSHTVHPYSFRLGILRDWKSRWLNRKQYREFLRGDVLIREWLEKRLKGMHVESVEMERSVNSFNVIIKTSRPGLIIGRGGGGAEQLKKEIQKMFSKIKAVPPKEIKLNIEEVRSPESKAAIVVQMIAEDLERRLPFRRVVKQTAEKVSAGKEVGGVKILLSGRLGGTEMARKESLRQGRMPLQTLRADVDFAKGRARLPYGDIGIKVWIFKKGNR
ncbi:MAG: 30S ribosomal protein S3 [Parcubacteria group bacterium GW2011_GWB1_41_6]|uniref:30S ribosomal protein S3 n=1 Tax=uncultured organism TaxID=155900 RepID=U3GQR7_9ZZZZ|nr:30S ribosomal protein S3 [uncultured organism]KKS15829.1 MAG: 30S ribosomal protein S3 [Parcubacteria group bacterium GW2011_GWB1_41_6]KKS58039.1 MAG: 30S ribosomal protein S3 [Parcubacteria group bacterium GW2011_GWA2_42_35]